MNEAVFNVLMDPAGAPAHPAIFLILGIVTFALHITAVALMLGTLALSLRGMLVKDDYSRRLAAPLAFTAKVSVAVAIVLGVAPLLFVQVIYDPFWYTSNVLSAVWTIVFLGLLMVGYLALYRFQAVNDDGTGHSSPMPQKGAFWLALALIVFVVCGWIIHSVSNQALFPGEFMKWYAPNDVIDPSGKGLHYTLIPRLLFFFALALPVTGAWLFGMRRYMMSAGCTDWDYIDWIEILAHKVSLAGGIAVLVTGVWWMLALPETMQWFTQSVWPWIGLVPVAYMLAMSAIQKKRRLCIFCNYMAFVMTVVMTLILAILREVLRYGTLMREAGWDAQAYKVNFDWASTAIFFVTFLVVGGAAIAYMLSLAWKAGLTQGGEVKVGAAVNKLGYWAVSLLGLWIVGYFVVGIATVAGL